jgi:Mg-chelatase subunit ChlD
VATACALVLLAASSVARAAGTLRTVLVIDASSSMRKTDPNQLRKVGAQLYVDLARDGDQIAVTGFDGAARDSTSAFTTIRGAADRDALKRAVRAVGDDGKWTDFTAGLAEAKRLLDSAPDEPGDQEIVVFLTDGRCDPDPTGPLATAPRPPNVAVEQHCQRKVVDELLPSLGAARVYAVGLSRAAPKAFLDEMARKTGGVGLATDKADELPRTFADIQARLLGGKLLEGAPAERIALAVDEGMLSLDVVAVGPPSLALTLLDPKGAAVAQDNRGKEAYFASTEAYRLLKVTRPSAGSWTLGVTGAAGGRYVALLAPDLELAFVDVPDVAEIGKQVRARVRLATSAGKLPPAEFLDRHELSMRVLETKGGCREQMLRGAPGWKPVKRGADGEWQLTHHVGARGELCFDARLSPGAGGVLTRSVGSTVIRLVPPLRLQGAPIDFGKVKQDASAKATLSLAGSEIGEAVEAKVGLIGSKKRFEIDVDELKLEPSGARTFEIRLEVDRDAPAGRAPLKMVVRPAKPKGYEERAIEVDVVVDVVPLTFWERYGFWVKAGAGALALLILLLGFLLPARFKKGTVLHYKDVRDPDLPREASYPLAVRAKPGFYRGARQLVGPTGPVKTGGIVELRPTAGAAVLARPLQGGARVRELPREDQSGMGLTGEPRPITLGKDGTFRASTGSRYEIEGSGLVFWVTGR